MKSRRYIPLICLALFTASCQDYLDTKPGDKYDDATIWSNTNLIDSYVFGIYKEIPYPFQWYTCAALVDEAVPVQNDGVVGRVLTGTMTPEEPAAFKDNWAAAMENWWWKSVYSHIRGCNLFFDKVALADNTDPAYLEQLTGEVHFLRAYFYYLLMAQYGGVPLVSNVVNIGDDYNVPRSSFAGTIAFILADLDEAVKDQRLQSQSDKTRATEGAVYALRSRVLLYAASDLHHRVSEWAPGFEQPELLGYTDADRTELYRQAKEAAEEVMGLGVYSLYDENADPAENYTELFLAMESDEQIFITKYDKDNDPYWATDWPAWVYGTPTYGGFGLNQVTGNLADAFENADGTPFDFAAQKADPYMGRDPRFYATILYDSADWYANANGEHAPAKIDIAGNDGKNLGTGYYLRKFISPLENVAYFGTRQPQPYMQIRYAEVLLNYAEACLGLSDEEGARDALNEIRERAGMPDIPDSETGDDLLERYRNERRVELAWECHRFFDVRRWMTAPAAYTEATGVTRQAEGYESFVYETRAWNNSHYLIPILFEELQKNTALVQNPGY